ncbi:MAG TPA: PIN domain-containing protein [Ktedonobacterales bacterium]|nr:PIN domain-containing protein [Ktedonobacterales bacterium]
MGSLTLPGSGSVYADANIFIYTVERIDPYRVLLDAFWRDVQNAHTSVLTSELSALEVLVRPIREGNATLEAAFRTVLFTSPDVQLLPVTISVLERAAQLRAANGLKTPDAIHAATALERGCSLFVTNDPAFRRVPGLPVTVIADLLAP